MRPKTTIEVPPRTGCGIVWITAPNFGGEAEDDREDRGDREEQRGVDARGGHHADVFTVGRHARAAEGAREHRRDAVAEERTAHVRVKVAARHGGHGLHVAEVLGNENDHDRNDERDGVHLEDRCVNRRNAEPGGVGDDREVDRLAHAEAVGEHRVDEVRDHKADEDEELLDEAARPHGNAGPRT